MPHCRRLKPSPSPSLSGFFFFPLSRNPFFSARGFYLKKRGDEGKKFQSDRLTRPGPQVTRAILCDSSESPGDTDESLWPIRIGAQIDSVEATSESLKNRQFLILCSHCYIQENKCNRNKTAELARYQNDSKKQTPLCFPSSYEKTTNKN